MTYIGNDEWDVPRGHEFEVHVAVCQRFIVDESGTVQPVGPPVTTDSGLFSDAETKAWVPELDSWMRDVEGLMEAFGVLDHEIDRLLKECT